MRSRGVDDDVCVDGRSACEYIWMLEGELACCGVWLGRLGMI